MVTNDDSDGLLAPCLLTAYMKRHYPDIPVVVVAVYNLKTLLGVDSWDECASYLWLDVEIVASRAVGLSHPFVIGQHAIYGTQTTYGPYYVNPTLWARRHGVFDAHPKGNDNDMYALGERENFSCKWPFSTAMLLFMALFPKEDVGHFQHVGTDVCRRARAILFGVDGVYHNILTYAPFRKQRVWVPMF